MDVMKWLCGSILYRSVIRFINDILVYYKIMEHNEKNLWEVLETLWRDRLYAKFSKCDYWFHKVQFLGHIVNMKGILVDPTKIKELMPWEVPRTPFEVRSLLRLAGYYQRFIRDFSKIVVPLTQLTKNDILSGGGLSSKHHSRP